MTLSKRLLNRLDLFWQQISKIFKFSSTYVYVLEELNLNTQAVVLRCKNVRTVLKTDCKTIISDSSLIAGLSPIHCAFIGGSFGRALRTSIQSNTAWKKKNEMSFLLQDNNGRYRIISEKRSGEIGYIDKKTKQIFVEDPLTIVNTDHIISRFDSSQACYLGILAGIRIENTKIRDKTTGQQQLNIMLNKPPKLRLVK